MMDDDIKYDNVNPDEKNTRNLLEYIPSKTPKKTIADDRKDNNYFINLPVDTNLIYNETYTRRKPYPWEDTIETSQITDDENNRLKIIYNETEGVKGVQSWNIEKNQELEKPKAKEKENKTDDYKKPPPKKKETVKNNPNAFKDTTTGMSTVSSRQKQVLDLLKSRGLSRIAVAGIMGNIQKETNGGDRKFSPMSVNPADTNGYPSVGLIQFQGKYHGNTKNLNTLFNRVGRDIPSQINYLFNNTNGVSHYLQYVANSPSADDAAYLFAHYVEICASCQNRTRYYGNNKYDTSDRSKYATDFFNRFNRPSDVLYWGSVDNTIRTQQPQTITDGSNYQYVKVYSSNIKIAIGTVNGNKFSKFNADDWGKKYKNFANLTYYEPSGKASGIFVINGRTNDDTGKSYYVSQSETRALSFSNWPAVVITKNNTVNIIEGTSTKTVEQQVLDNLSNIKYAFAASHILMRKGGSLKPGKPGDSGRPKTSIGINNNNFIIAVTKGGNNQTWNTWGDTLRKIDSNAIWLQMDCGGSSMLTVNGIKKIQQNRAIPTIINWT